MIQRMLNKGFYLLLVVMIAGSMVYALIVHESFRDDIDIEQLVAKGDSKVSLDDNESYLTIYFKNKFESEQELAALSPFILTVQPIERTFESQTILTTVKVIDVIKGSEIQAGTDIRIAEPSFFSFGNYFSLGGYNLMEPNKTYILYVENLEVPKDYQYNSEQAITYKPVSSLFSKYELLSDGNDLEEVRTLNENETYTYKDVKHLPIITTNNKEIELYNNLSHQVKKRVSHE